MPSELKPFLTEIANAIRNKKGTTAPINAQNFASEIEGIETGGGGSSVPKFKSISVLHGKVIETLSFEGIQVNIPILTNISYK